MVVKGVLVSRFTTLAKRTENQIDDIVADEPSVMGDEIRRASQSAVQELERLAQFTKEFTSFARLPKPDFKQTDLADLLEEFVTTYSAAWGNLELALEADGPCVAQLDRDMLRQVLVNLCDNSSLALGDRDGSVIFELGQTDRAVQLDVRDDGPGVAENVRRRLFEPYTTTRKIGKGMGLGLAIARKIMLDHDGDLELLETSEEGTVFRLTLPRSVM